MRAMRAPFAAAAVVLAAAAPAGRRQSSQPPPQPTFRTEANYVRVDAYPTDANGNPVTDLNQQDFEVLESGVPQRIDQFERVQIRANLPQDVRPEPNTVEAGRQAAQNPRARVFVIFLDYNHVGIEGSYRIRQPLIDTLNHLIGPEDLFAVMTPEMSARDLTFARRTTTIEGFLTRYWTWGERNQSMVIDPVEDEYRTCYPGLGPTACNTDDRGIADRMIERRKEKLTLDALDDLVRYLRGVREERKAVLVITEGWRLFRPDPSLATQQGCQVPVTTIGIDPRTAKPTSDPVAIGAGSSMLKCERDRQNLAAIDDDDQFRRMLDEANRANTSFYPVEPRGLVVFDEPIAKPTTGLPPPGATTMTPPAIDQSRLRARHEALRTLAGATDGRAILDSNDLERGLKRAVDDLSSYYLLGYYSTGRLDGKFHPITVRVKRPGVQVRARRGYLAATPADVNGSAAPPAMPSSTPSAETLAMQTALAPLGAFGRDESLRVLAAAGWRPGRDGHAIAAFWIVREVGAGVPAARDVDVSVIASSGVTIGRATGQSDGRSVLFSVSPSEEVTSGTYTVRVRSEGLGTGTVTVNLPAAPDAAGAIFRRRGPTTGNRDTPTADLRFRRNERLRIDVPTPDEGPVSARLLDRTGKPLSVPLTAAIRDDGDGSRWQTTDVVLAPLAVGDYVVELLSGEAGDKRTLVAFRIVP